MPVSETALRALAILLAAGAAGYLLHRLLLRVLERHAGAGPDGADFRIVLRQFARPSAWGLPLLAIYLAVSLLLPELDPGGPVAHFLAIGIIFILSWVAIGFVRAGEEVLRRRFQVEVRDNLRARQVHTQAEVVRKILVVIICLLALAGILMTFEPLREIGTGLLASAGLAGLILGLAAQRTLGNLLAGIQIALTQPIRLDDVVIVEGEWGRIEEITLTYVVVRIWDLRRMVVPISWFIENPFQNWTRTSADILGTVFLYVDYNVAVEEVRKKLEGILADHPDWDGKVAGVQVTDARERTVELRCLMSARDSGAAWDLRCHVRERLLEWLRTEHPESLPRLRAELEPIPREADREDPSPPRRPADPR